MTYWPHLTRIRGILLSGLLALGLSACMDAPNEVSNAGNPPPITTARALSIFNNVCGGSLPNFASAERRMKAAGITRKASTGTVYSTTADLSFKIVDSPGIGKSCSMVWATTESDDQIARSLLAFRPFTDGPLGPGAIYRDGVLMLLKPPSRQGRLKYHNIRMLSQR